MDLIPLNDNLVLEEVKYTYTGSIVVLDPSKLYDPYFGKYKVLSVGPGRKSAKGIIIPVSSDIKKDVIVFIGKRDIKDISIRGNEYKLASASRVLYIENLNSTIPIHPVNDSIVLELIEPEYAGLLDIPIHIKASMPRFLRFKVLSVGPGHYTDRGVFIPMSKEICVGSIIMINKAHAYRYLHAGVHYWLSTRLYTVAVEE